MSERTLADVEPGSTIIMHPDDLKTLVATWSSVLREEGNDLIVGAVKIIADEHGIATRGQAIVLSPVAPPLFPHGGHSS